MLESEKDSQNISNQDTIRELHNRIEQLESEKNIQNISYLQTISELHKRIEQLEEEKNNQNILTQSVIKELSNRVEQIESEKSIQFIQLANGILTVLDTFEKMKQKVLKKALKKTSKGKKNLARYKKVRNSFEELLTQFEITKIIFPDSQMIPGFCKIVGTEADAAMPDNTMLTIVKNGYIRGAEVIREAEVIVVKNLQDDQPEISDAGLNHSV
jgi:molecular chaperone GrpE (heat shock protein)